MGEYILIIDLMVEYPLFADQIPEKVDRHSCSLQQLCIPSVNAVNDLGQNR